LRTFGKVVKGLTVEAAWQREFYRTATSLLPTGNTLSAEVPRLYASRKLDDDSGESMADMDFFVDGDLKWIIEVLVRRSTVESHLQRFIQGGQYSSIPFRDWVVVDFRLIGSGKLFPSAMPADLQSHYVVVEFDPEFVSLKVTTADGENVFVLGDE
jgi:hypothetical protein